MRSIEERIAAAKKSRDNAVSHMQKHENIATKWAALVERKNIYINKLESRLQAATPIITAETPKESNPPIYDPEA